MNQVVRFGIGLAVFAAVLWYLLPSWTELTAQVDVAVPFLALGLLGAGLAHLFVAARWKLLSESSGGDRLSLWGYLHSLLVARFLGQFSSPLAMDLVGRGVLLRTVGSRQGIGHATTLVVLERSLDVLLPAALLSWALTVSSPGLQDHAVMLLAMGLVGFVVLAALGFKPLARMALALYRRVTRAETEDLQSALTLWISCQVVLLSVMRFTAVIVQFAGVGAGIGVLLPWTSWVAATPIAQLSALVGVTPGGLGVVEVGWWAGLAWVGVERSAIGLFILAQRVALIAFLGGLALATRPLARTSPAVPGGVGAAVDAASRH